ncbi:MAG: SRPBCC family protein [Caulobacterales bacterium]
MGIKLENSFLIELPIDKAWTLLNDIERIAPCVPGARLTEVEGGEYRGSVKVKLGPITAEYKGGASIQESDAAAKRMVVSGKGRDVHGQGAASGDLVLTMAEADGGTRVDVSTDVQVAGKVAQLGKSVMQDVAAKLIDQFVANLREVAASAPDAAPAVSEPASVAAVAAEPAPIAAVTEQAPVPAPAVVVAPAAPAAGPRIIESKEAEAIDLLDLGSAVMAKRAGYVVVAAVVVLLAVIAGLVIF